MNVLVIEGDPAARRALRTHLADAGHSVAQAEDGTTASAVLEWDRPDLILLDLELRDVDGLELLRWIRNRSPDSIVIGVTRAPSERAAAAMSLGAFACLPKNRAPEQAAYTADRAGEMVRLRELARRLLFDRKSSLGLHNLVGKSSVMQGVRAAAWSAAEEPDRPCLILGERGTGKDALARAIHVESERAEHPIVRISCGELTEAQIQSRLEEAEAGTLLLDEAGLLSPEVQNTLSRALDSGLVGRQPLRARVIAAATNSAPDRLFQHVSPILFHLPPLRGRTEDIPTLVEYFLQRFALEFRKATPRLAEDGIGLLLSHPWPGNVRELRNAVEFAVLLGSGPLLTGEDILLRSGQSRPNHFVTLPREGVQITELEKDLVLQALRRTGWVKTRAAALLGMTPDQLYHRIEKYNLTQ